MSLIHKDYTSLKQKHIKRFKNGTKYIQLNKEFLKDLSDVSYVTNHTGIVGNRTPLLQLYNTVKLFLHIVDISDIVISYLWGDVTGLNEWHYADNGEALCVGSIIYDISPIHKGTTIFYGTDYHAAVTIDKTIIIPHICRIFRFYGGMVRYKIMDIMGSILTPMLIQETANYSYLHASRMICRQPKGFINKNIPSNY